MNAAWIKKLVENNSNSMIKTLPNFTRYFVREELAIFALLAIVPLCNGFPLLHSDSLSYMVPPSDFTRATVVSLVAQPFYAIFGIWGLALLQIAVGSYLLGEVARRILARYRLPAILLAAVLGGAVLGAGQIMADIWSLYGVLAIYLFSLGWGGFAGIIFIAFCMATHYSNFFIFPPLLLFALLYIGGASLRSTVAKTAACGLLAVSIAAASNVYWGSPRLFGSTISYTWLGGKILRDMPQVFDRYCEAEPQPDLCRYKADIDYLRPRGNMIWHGTSPRKNPDFGIEAFEKASRELTYLSLRQPWLHLDAALADFGRMLMTPLYLHGYQLSMDLRYRIAADFPSDLDAFDESLQRRPGNFSPIGRVSVVLGTLSLVFLIIGFVTLILFARQSKTDLWRFGLFAYIALVINDLIFAALSGAYPRYHFKMLYPCLFFTAAWILVVWRSRGIAQQTGDNALSTTPVG